MPEAFPEITEELVLPLSPESKALNIELSPDLRWEPTGIIECDGVRLDPGAMNHDEFFEDLICGFGKLLNDTYRRLGDRSNGCISQGVSGIFHVNPLVHLGTNGCYCTSLKRHQLSKCPYAYDRLFLSVKERTLIVTHCPNPSKCQASRKVTIYTCVDVEKIARQYMYWFILSRARIRIEIPAATDAMIEDLFRSHSKKCGDDDLTPKNIDWNWRRNALCKLVWEIKIQMHLDQNSSDMTANH